MERRSFSGLGPGCRLLGPALALALSGAAAAQQPFGEEQAISAANPVGAFGTAVALNPNGGSLLAGDPQDTVNGPASGSATLYVRQNTTWLPVCRLLPDTGWAGERFGSSVAIDDGANRLVVGSPQAWVGSVQAGAVYVFDRHGPQWVQTKKLVDVSVIAGEQLGSSLALSADGTVLAVGAPGARRLRVWEYDGMNWVQKLALQSGLQDLGASMAMNDAGTRIAVGAPLAAGGGRVTVLDRKPNFWLVTASLQPSDLNGGDRFGTALAFDSNGQVVLIGDDGFSAGAGMVSVCQDTGTGWTEVDRLQPSDAQSGAGFGRAISVDAAKGRLVVGAPADSGQGAGSGAAYLFEPSGTTWSETERLAVSAIGAGDALGTGVAAAAGRLAVGAPGDGSAGRVSVLRPMEILYCTGTVNSQGCTATLQIAGAASATDLGSFDLTVSNVVSNKAGLPFYGLMGPGSLPFAGGILCVQPPLRRSSLAWSAGNPPPDDCSGVLSADFNAVIQSGQDPLLVPGAVVNLQFWYRDPASYYGNGFGLSNATQFEILP